MECPKCHSDDLTKSRRRFADTIFLPLLRAEVFRCRDCHKRFWVCVQWGPVVLVSTMAVLTTFLIVVVMFAHQRRADESSPVGPSTQPRGLTPFRPVFQKEGLPPLSSVPKPANEDGEAGKR
jgi:hypothetical protein